MAKDDFVLFYHSVSEKQIVGIARVQKEAYPDPTAKEGDWSCVDLSAIKPLNKPLTLQQIKEDKVLRHIALVKQSRLSVVPLTAEQFKRILELAQTCTPEQLR